MLVTAKEMCEYTEQHFVKQCQMAEEKIYPSLETSVKSAIKARAMDGEFNCDWMPPAIGNYPDKVVDYAYQLVFMRLKAAGYDVGKHALQPSKMFYHIDWSEGKNK